MKITPHAYISNTLKTGLVTGMLLVTPQFAPTQVAPKRETLTNDIFEKTEYPDTLNITPKGISDVNTLMLAPSPEITVKGKLTTATFVVDLSHNVLFHYDEYGIPQKAYLIASGKPETPTAKGVRVVSHTERYPYKSAPEHTKRRKNPNDYGPRIIILDKYDPKTGERSNCGEFIHGNRNASTIGKYVSKGCMRMDNEVIKELAQVVERGDIVIIK